MLTFLKIIDIIFIVVCVERWSSWFKAPVLKTGVRVTAPRVRIPIFPPLFYIKNYEVEHMEKYSSG